MSKRTVVNLVWFGLVASLFFVWAVRNILPLDVINKPYTIKAQFANSLGMQAGNEVAYLGVQYGSVSGVKRVPGGVLVSMKIDRNKKIPEGSTANLYRKSAIGEQYVDFAPPANFKGTGASIKEGEVIPMARTTVPLEFSELLRSASRLVAGIPPEDVHTVVHELAVGLNGRTDSLRQLTEAGDDISKMLVARTDALDRLAVNNTRLTHVVTDHRGSLGESLADLRQLADSLKNARGDPAGLLDRGNKLLAQTADIVAHNKGNLDCSLKVLENVIDETSTPTRLDQTATLLRDGPGGLGAIWDARDVEPDGVWVRVGFLANTENKAPQFVPTHHLPSVAKVPACASPLQPVSLDYRPASLDRPVVGDGARAVIIGLLLSLVMGVAVFRETARLPSRG